MRDGELDAMKYTQVSNAAPLGVQQAPLCPDLSDCRKLFLQG